MRWCVVPTAFGIIYMLASASAESQTPKSSGWEYINEGEDIGWNNNNSNGESIFIYDCEYAKNKEAYRFFFIGVFERYSTDKNRDYWLSAGMDPGDQDEVYVYTSKEYLDYIYSFSVDTGSASLESELQFCARAMDEEATRCEKFSGANFRKVVEDLCLSPNPSISEDPRIVVEQFYGALESGDGRAASAHVIPEKRTTGPFSASELSSFYGNLKKPLRLISVTETGQHHFRVRYTFETKNGKVCDGVSFVTVKAANGRNLIAKIRAESGC